MNFIEKHFLGRAAQPSNLPSATRLLELVVKGCADTTKWEGNPDSRWRKEYAQNLQTDILKAAFGIGGSGCELLSCGDGVSVTASQGSRLRHRGLPPSNGLPREMPELTAAYAVVKGLRSCGDLPGDGLKACALLLLAAAELERALECPAGFAKLPTQ